MQEIRAACKRTFTAVHHSGPRLGAKIKWVVLHTTEGDTAVSAAAWFANPKSSGSAHLCLDDNVCYRTLSDSLIPWAAPGANTNGIHIEMAGHAAWTDDQWRARSWTVKRAAYKTAYHCHLYGIPLRWVGKWGLKLGRKGVTTHKDCSAAFGGDHWDPGPNFPKTRFMDYARQYLAQMQTT